MKEIFGALINFKDKLDAIEKCNENDINKINSLDMQIEET